MTSTSVHPLLAKISTFGGGFISPSISMSSTTTSADAVLFRGILSTSFIPCGTRLLTIPSRYTISPTSLPSSSTNSQGMSDWLKTTISLMLMMVRDDNEKEKNENVKKVEGKVDDGASDESTSDAMRVYIESLPKDYNTIMDWTSQEVSELKGTSLYLAVVKDRDNNTFRKSFEDNVKPHIERLDVGKEIKARLTFDVFEQASKAVVTRGFNYGSSPSGAPSGPYMIPLVDMLNHDHSPTRRSTTLKRDDEGNFYMDAERDIKEGEEILHSYTTDSSNDSMLRTYGFVHSAPPVCTPKLVSKEDVILSCLKAARGAPKATKTEGRKKGEEEFEDEDELESWDATKGWDAKSKYLLSTPIIPPSLTIRMEDPLTDSLVTACVIMLLSEEGFKELFEDDENPAVLDKGMVMEEEYLGSLVAMAIIELVEDEEGKYKTNIKDDEEILSSPDISHRLKCAVTVRLEEKRSLLTLKKFALELLHDGDKELDDKEDVPSNNTQRIKLF
mmetsp:Transcript_14776/g.30414  ORF Transcript_14776/g.30414 Transcript_14776/m.30414 type:complete len:502 (-) Transcript_14776:13-1518(-)